MVIWTPEIRPCPCCGATQHRLLGRRGGAAHRIGLGTETTIVRCRSCHAVYPRPFLIPQGNPYEAHDADGYFHDKDTAAKHREGRQLAKRATAILGREGRVLEIGCGRGELLLGAIDEGWQAEGVDATDWGASDVSIEHATVETSTRLGQRGRYDFIIMAAILEHLYDPVAVLRRVHHALVQDGLIFIDVPNECGLWTRVGNAYNRVRGRGWAINLSPTFAPYHVVGFCPKSLRRTLARASFAVNSLQTERYQNALPRERGAVAALEHVAANATLALGQKIGMGAGLTCWARRA